MAGIVDLREYREARGRGVRPGTAALSAELADASIVKAEDFAPAASWERQCGAEVDEPEVLRAEEYEYRDKTVRLTTTRDGDVVLAVETDDGRQINQLAAYLDDEGLDWLADELAHASAVRSAIIGTAS